jgi:hypothetical protein
VFLYVVTGLGVIDDCVYVGISLVVLNVINVIFIYWLNPYQPRIFAHGNAIVSFSQAMSIMLSMAHVGKSVIDGIFITSNVLGFICCIVLPLAYEIYLQYRKVENLDVSMKLTINDTFLEGLLVSIAEIKPTIVIPSPLVEELEENIIRSPPTPKEQKPLSPSPSKAKQSLSSLLSEEKCTHSSLALEEKSTLSLSPSEEKRTLSPSTPEELVLMPLETILVVSEL